MDLRSIIEDQNPWWREPEARGAPTHVFRRPLQHKIMDQLGREDRRAVLILGPRQVGKTVLLRQTADDLLDRDWPASSVAYFDFSDARITRQLFGHEVIEALPAALPERPRVLLLDEISGAVNWDRWLKQTVDRGGLRIVATDSAASTLAHGGRESGLGRWDEHHLEGLTFREFVALNVGEGETIEQTSRRLPNLKDLYLALGGFPEYARSIDVRGVRARLREDISAKAIERDLARFGLEIERVRALFTYLVASSGDIWDAQGRADDLKADRRTVGEWLQKLKDTALVVALDQHTGDKPTLRLRARPKIYAADHGLVNAFASAPLRSAEARPKVFETVVYRHLRELLRDPLDRLSYLRVGNRLELDFFLATADRRVGVEVTSSAEFKGRSSQLNEAAERLGLDSVFLVYDGLAEREVRTEKGPTITLLSLSSFLLHPERILEGRRDA